MAVLLGLWLGHMMPATPLSWGLATVAAGVLACLLAWLTRQPPWWRLIHAGFLPLVWAVNQLAIDPGWYLLAFCCLLLVFRGAVTGRVPLYLSNARTAAALASLVRARQVRRLADLGAGIGSIVRPLALADPGLAVVGVENAPLTWLVGWLLLRCAGLGRVGWRCQSLWDTGLGDCDLVYAFLSPEPMAALWDKARAEMAPGTMLVSNSFPVPEVTPSQVIMVEDARHTALYCYSLP